MKIRKVVIPVAGLGTRFLPATKAQPKEMLPIVDKPIIQYVVEEAVRAGFTEIILVTGSTKRAIEDHFDRNETLEKHLRETAKSKALKMIKEVAELANFIYIRQKGPYGNGTPVLNAEAVVGDEPFAVVWGDEFWKAKKPHLQQLVEVFEAYGGTVVSSAPTDSEGTKKYGIIEGERLKKDIYRIKRITEKPGPEKTQSRLAAFGGYIITPEIFTALKKTALGKNNELWLVDAIGLLQKKQGAYAKVIDGTYFDLGNKLEWLKANVEFGLADHDFGPAFKKFINSKIR